MKKILYEYEYLYISFSTLHDVHRMGRDATRRRSFIREARTHRMVHENLIRFFHGFNHDAHPMAIMVGVAGALSAFYNDGLDIQDPSQRNLAAIRVFGKMTTLAAMVRELPGPGGGGRGKG